MADVRVRLPLGTCSVNETVRDVGKPGPIRLPWEQEIAGSNPAIPTVGRDDSGGVRAGTSTRLLPGGTRVRFLPPELNTRKDKPIGDGTRPEPGRAMSLEGSTPSPSAGKAAGLVQWHDSWLPTRRPGFDSPIPHSKRW